ncbi:hypothetical protein GV828_02040 [Flavobacterium sp. NST-5]|uniref:DUF8201 domain-containing protein n=1 Tax=Flavobacterium ichthyis TaxID=2698827 RepID=A0ABW9ZA55_9FLAO|nr:hypothetical protein [Flavobacterium ichthyis]NBL63975.1 hypothetical protein [Flavobacterium ichthyis]
MLLILLSWIYILFTCINYGFLLDKILRLKAKNFVIIAILGLFSTTIIANIWAIFGRINVEFHAAMLVGNLILWAKCRSQISFNYKNFFTEITQLEKSLKVALFLISIFILAQCASIPYAIDNESYYIQTIKWINEYGFVKGLANIHIFLGQTSGWHITQSVFNFSFLYNRFNDISGFCLLFGNIFAIQKLNNYFKHHRKTDLIIGLFPLANILLFQFISTPSPDLPVYVFTFIIFSYFLDNYDEMTTEVFHLISILVLFCLSIKPTTIGITILPLFILLQNFRQIKIYKIAAFSFLILGLFVAKNLIVTGYALFPMTQTFGFVADYQVPEKIAVLYYSWTKYFAYSVTEAQFNSMTNFEIFSRWLFMPKLHGIFNKISLFLVIFTPIIIYKFFRKTKFWVLYFAMLLQLLLLFLSSPQYRFFLNFILFFSLIWFGILIDRKKIILVSLYASMIFVGIVLFIPIHLKNIARNTHAVESSTFSFKNVIFPYSNSKYNTGFELITQEKFFYNSPTEIDFFWGTGNGKLPCVNKIQIDYFEKNYAVKPQMRSTHLKDGFYAKDTSTE